MTAKRVNINIDDFVPSKEEVEEIVVKAYGDTSGEQRCVGRPFPQFDPPSFPGFPPPFVTADEPVRAKHNHYHKDVRTLEFVDVYRVLTLFNVTDPCIQHAVKKLLVAGGRGAGKDIKQDIQESIDSLQRWQEMEREDTEGKTLL